MQVTRRDTLALGLGAAALAALPLRAQTADANIEAAILDFTGDADLADGGVTLTAPEIAENGNTVPIKVEAPGASEILVLAAGNPNPQVGRFAFGPLAASQYASTRIRLAQTQDVIAIAKLGDGTFARTSQEVKVTIGGCGG